MFGVPSRQHHVVVISVFIVQAFLLMARPAAAANDLTIEFMASTASWEDHSATGHAFVCVGVKVGSGIKEECLGFYPANGGKGAVYGPGCVDSELNGKCADHPITRFSNVVTSLRKPINDAQRRAIYQVGVEWNKKQFALGWRDCVAFSNSVAAAAGLNVPAITATLTPAKYVELLKKINP